MPGSPGEKQMKTEKDLNVGLGVRYFFKSRL